MPSAASVPQPRVNSRQRGPIGSDRFAYLRRPMSPASFLRFLLGLTTAFISAAGFAAPGDGIANSAHNFVRGAGSGSTGLCNTCHVTRTTGVRTLGWFPDATGDWIEPNALSGQRTHGASHDRAGPSDRCLSCHDGTVAVGDTGALPRSSDERVMATLRRVGSAYESVHSVPMPYPYAGTRSTYKGVTERASDLDGFMPDPTTGNIRLYSESGGRVAARPKRGATGIECSSCHDPHNTEARERHLLRAPLDGASTSSGYLCNQCHGLHRPA